MTSPFDDRLRDELEAAIPTDPPDDPDGLFESLLERAATPPPPPPPPVGGIGGWLAAFVVAGAALGGWLGFTGVGAGSPEGAVLPHDGVAVFVCPGDGQAGTLHRGDRVLILGATADAQWLSVRNVRGSLEPVFVRASDIAVDGSLEGLPERSCEQSVAVTVATAPAASTTTSTSQPAGSSTTSSSAPPTATTGTTAPPDTTDPVIGQVSVDPDPIWELDTDSISCGANPRVATVSASVADAGGVQSVILEWEFQSGESGATAMTGAGTYSGGFGPFPYLTVPDSQFELVTLTITATDASGNTAVALTDVTVVSTATCFG